MRGRISKRKKKIFSKAALLLAVVAAFLSGFITEALAASKAPTAFTIGENAKYKASPFDYTDTRDAEWVTRGFIARVAKDEAEPLRITTEDGTVVWDMGRYDYISGDIANPDAFPDTVNPSLWRQAILNAHYGLYEVASRDFGGEVRAIYQVRGYDIANMSFVETKNGFLVVDVTSYKESAAAAVKLLYDHLPAEKRAKKIHTVIYTHSHADHYGGISGVLESGHTAADLAIVAPDGFMEAAVSENVTVGEAMRRRARWMYGIPLWTLGIPEGRGQVNNGLAIGSGAGTNELTAPTTEVTKDGTMSFDGMSVEFLLAPGTEAPAEMAMFFPDYRSICLAEICNQTQHNLLTPRGAQVRDAIAWSEALDKMKQKWADQADSAWGPHHWPRWGSAAIGDYIAKQSALYRDLHDQTVALMNSGLDMRESAEAFTLSPDLAYEWFNRGYYGATVHNVKAVYQKYLGWFDNNPATLWELPDRASAELYAKYLPGGGSLLDAARAAYADGQYRWVASVLEHIRLAPDDWESSVYAAATDLQADAFEQMAYATESGIWRNYFLTGAWRNRSETIRNLLEMPVTNASSLLAAYRAQTASGARSAVTAAAAQSKPPTAFTIAENAKVKESLPFATDTRDAEWVKRGFIARVVKGASEPLKITMDDGTLVWDMSRYEYISGDIAKPDTFPDTVNPSLWRQAILNAHYGLYEVASRDFGGEVRSIYQVRGYDLANMSFVETANGFIVVDVTSYKESAEAAVALLYDNLPEEKKSKKIHTIIYTHSHVDHYGGIEGVIASGKTVPAVATVAPDGFWDAAFSENVTVGPAMTRRARWMYGLLLWRIDIPKGQGQVNNGLAVGSGAGSSNLEPPTNVVRDGTLSFDGTDVEFLLAPGTEAPAEMVMFFPDYRSLCLAEICNQSQHNILTPRGAQVRDTLAWSEALAKMKAKWVDAGLVDSAWGPHHWPRWGGEAIGEYIGKQSRLYRHLHDRTVELMNEGLDMKEAAERFTFPPDLANEWFNRGYYGATVHNVKAVYQKYLGWFDNNPAKLWALPGSESAKRYAKYLSGGPAKSLLDAARTAYADGEYRWVVEVLDHVRLAPNAWDAATYAAATELQADAFEQMAYSAESGIWRNYFLTGAWRNRDAEFRKFLEGGGNDGDDGSSGCDAGVGALGIAALALTLSLRRKKK